MTQLENLDCDQAQQLLFLLKPYTLIETKLMKKLILRRKKKSKYYNTKSCDQKKISAGLKI